MSNHSTSSDHWRELILRIRKDVIAFDIYTLAIMGLYSVLAIALFPYVPMASSILIQNVFIATVIVASIILQTLTGMKFFGIIRYFYIIPVIYLMYDQTHLFVQVVHPVDYDDVLIVADRVLFGVDPTSWMHQFSSPVLTEYLQICYFLFYLLPIMQAIELWRKGKLEQLAEFSRGMAFCYFVSYLLYFAMPAIGPRFTLHDFSSINTDLPGIMVTNILRGIIDSGGGVAWGQPEPAGSVNRDCMPSGHTMMTLVNILLAFRYKSRFKWLFVLIGGSLIISTVYLRYHYAIDVIIGALLAVVTLPLEPVVNRLATKRISEM